MSMERANLWLGLVLLMIPFLKLRTNARNISRTRLESLNNCDHYDNLCQLGQPSTWKLFRVVSA